MLEFKNVNKSFGERLVIDNLSLSLRRGEVLGLLGPNGAGKTTTMRLATTLLEPDSGAIFFNNHNIQTNALAFRGRLGYMPENNPLYDEMLTGEYLTYVAELKGLTNPRARKAIDQAVQKAAIGEVFYRPIMELSKGFRQRVGLAQAILGEPELLILDEPTEGLDPNQRVEIRKLIQALGVERTVIISTHVLQEVTATCDRVVIINKGQIAADGTPDELIALASGANAIELEVEGEFDPDKTLAGIESIEKVRRLKKRGERAVFEIVFKPKADPRAEIFDAVVKAHARLWELKFMEASLEEVFGKITRS